MAFCIVNNSFTKICPRSNCLTDVYREWLAKGVKEGFIKQYTEEDLLDRTLLGHGGY
ncbi:4645_t:CDS:1, partial [Paraglomus occultum]